MDIFGGVVLAPVAAEENSLERSASGVESKRILAESAVNNLCSEYTLYVCSQSPQIEKDHPGVHKRAGKLVTELVVVKLKKKNKKDRNLMICRLFHGQPLIRGSHEE